MIALITGLVILVICIIAITILIFNTSNKEVYYLNEYEYNKSCAHRILFFKVVRDTCKKKL